GGGASVRVLAPAPEEQKDEQQEHDDRKQDGPAKGERSPIDGVLELGEDHGALLCGRGPGKLESVLRGSTPNALQGECGVLLLHGGAVGEAFFEHRHRRGGGGADLAEGAGAYDA